MKKYTGMDEKINSRLDIATERLESLKDTAIETIQN